MANETTNGFVALDGQKYANLTTFRKSGQPVTTPVWFALVNGRAYVMTIDGSGKVKRIRNNGRAQIAPSTARGEPLGAAAEATARVLPAAESEQARQALNRKYGLAKRVFDLLLLLRRAPVVHLEIMPS